MPDLAYELIGWTGSVLIVVALTMKSIRRLRLIGLAGAATFLVYGLLIDAYPIAIVNAVIIGIHIYHLRKMARIKEYFSVLAVRPESRYLEYFCSFYADDIHRYLPDFAYEPRQDQIRAFVLRDLVPAGLFIADRRPDGDLDVRLDYVIPQYRDWKVARYVYSADSGVIDGSGSFAVWCKPGTEVHLKYLERMGFDPVGDAYRLELQRPTVPAA